MIPVAQEPGPGGNASPVRFRSWGGEDLNLRPTDYEFDPAPFVDLGETGEKDCDPAARRTRPYPPFRNISRSLAGQLRDTFTPARVPKTTEVPDV
jgi:hypothetical protein